MTYNAKKKTFTTPAGTELDILNLKGKDYLEVKYRMVWFREVRPEWSIETEIVDRGPDFCLTRAIISNEQGRRMAMAHKYENKLGFGDFIEKSETGAIGRALALCGFGTQFCADDLDEGQRIVDSPGTPPSKSTENNSQAKVGASAPKALPQASAKQPQAGAPFARDVTPVDPKEAAFAKEPEPNFDDPITVSTGHPGTPPPEEEQAEIERIALIKELHDAGQKRLWLKYVKDYMMERYKAESSSDLTIEQIKELTAVILKLTPKQAQEALKKERAEAQKKGVKA